MGVSAPTSEGSLQRGSLTSAILRSCPRRPSSRSVLPATAYVSGCMLVLFGVTYTIEGAGRNGRAEEPGVPLQELIFLIVASDQIRTAGDEAGLHDSLEEPARNEASRRACHALSDNGDTCRMRNMVSLPRKKQATGRRPGVRREKQQLVEPYPRAAS